MRRGWAVLSLLLMTAARVLPAAETVYLSPSDFLQEYLPGCEPGVLWLRADVKAEAEAVLGHPFPGVRARYCARDGRTAWILDEIGKTEPITTGIVVDHGRVERVRVLVFRESRGYEVHRDAFVAQYDGATLEPDRELDRSIDGITGATLSVRAVGKQVRLALLFDAVVRETGDGG